MAVSPLLGIPALLSEVAAAIAVQRNSIRPIVADAYPAGPFDVPVWGLYLKGAKAIECDSVTAFSFRNETRISDYPLEDGFFETYNKIATPFELRLTLTRGGTQSQRATFLKEIEAIAASFDLYDVFTAERNYIGVSVQHIDIERSATKGAGMISAELSLLEVRAFATSAFVAVAAPPAADPASVGEVKAAAPTPAQTKAVERHGATGSW